jgi:hypothetical protein
MKSVDYQGKNKRLFDESFVLKSLEREGLAMQFANSYILHATSSSGQEPAALALFFSTDRAAKFCVETRFESEENGGSRITLRKSHLKESNSSNELDIKIVDNLGVEYVISHTLRDATSAYVPGKLLGFHYTKSLVSRDVKQAQSLLFRWLDWIFETRQFFNKDSRESEFNHCISGFDCSKLLIDGCSLDLGLHNVVEDENGEFFEIDREWVANRPIPFFWFLFRNSAILPRSRLAPQVKVRYREIISSCCERVGLSYTQEDFDSAMLLEDQFQAQVKHHNPSVRVPIEHVKLYG